MPDYPALRIDSVRKLVDDGLHNAFTDLARFRGELYLAYRACPEGHMQFETSRIVVLASSDGAAWREVLSFGVPLRDVRDPHFLVFRDTLFVYTGTWLCDPSAPGVFDVNDHLGYAVWTQDGRSWNGPRSMEGTYGHYIWRAASYGPKAYLCARRVRDFPPPSARKAGNGVMQAALLESEDGLVWKWAGFFKEVAGDETAFLFEPDGELVAVVRGAEAFLCRARPPYREWTRTGLGCFVGGPLLVKWGGRYLVGGRKVVATNGPDAMPRTVLSWLIDGRLVDAATLPSGGDTSYPGFVPFSDTRGLLSYYSSHEGSGTTLAPCAIYLAEVSLG